LQSDDRRIQKLARSAGGPRVDDARKMEQLTALTARLISQADFSGHFSAVETLQRGSSDCFGTAVLLAALGRAAGIPTRVADGLVYSADRYHGMSNAFLPHSWVLAYVGGRWRSYDAGLPSFDTTHIALTIGDGDERHFFAAEQLASLLTWQAMSEVRSAPSP
jgi:transglutaminase-like putative cysteine protease